MDTTFTIGGPSLGAVGMTLAAMAYAPDRGAIEQLLADATLATNGRWTLVWFARDDANQVFIARDTVTGQQAVVIRGSVTDPREAAFWLDWFAQDLSVFRMANWPYGGAPSGSRLSHGALAGLGSLLTLKDENRTSIVAFLRANAGSGLTAVVGHSLGGALAYVLTAYLGQEFGADQHEQRFWPVTFAAPTVGNSTFSIWLATAFSAAAGRFWNSDDVVPRAWMEVGWVAESFPAGPKLPLALVGLIDGIRGTLALLDDRYVQPDGQMLSGAIASGDDWFTQAGVQHSGSTYLSLLGAPPMPPARPLTVQTSL